MKEQLNPKSLGLALGVIEAVALFILGLLAMATGYAVDFVNLTATFYIGYSATIVGSIIGVVWGFVDGFVGGWLVAWLYNKFNS